MTICSHQIVIVLEVFALVFLGNSVLIDMYRRSRSSKLVTDSLDRPGTLALSASSRSCKAQTDSCEAVISI